jgi:hypothetical protein
MARKVTGGLVGSPSVGALNVAPTAVVTAADDQDITLSPSGTGMLMMTSNAQLQAQSDLRFADADSSNWVAFQAPSTVASNVTWTLPATDGTSNQVLTTNASGTLSWSTPSVSISDNTSDSGANYVVVTTATSGGITSARVSSTGLSYQPSTATLTVNGTVNSYLLENVQSTSYTLALSDRDKSVVINSASATTVTVPLNSAVAFPVGAVIYIYRAGAGTVTLAASVGVTISKTGILAQYEELYVRKRGTDDWVVGDSYRVPVASGGTLVAASGYNTHSFTSTGSTNLVVGT